MDNVCHRPNRHSGWRTCAAVLLAMLAACSPDERTQPDEAGRTGVVGGPAGSPSTVPPGSTMLQPAALTGTWDIVAVDGRAPRSIGDDADRRRTPRLVFSQGGYGGTTGCNHIGGLGLIE